MKKIIVSLLIGISVSVCAQKYVPFPTANAQWNVFYASSLYGSPTDTTLLKYTIKGDTIINEVTYHKLCKNIGSDESPQYIFAGGLREQDKKIFFYGFGYSKSNLSSLSNKEYLLYDFNKEIGDSVMFDQERWYKITNMDSVKIGSNFRKRYQIRIGISPESEYIIEGIGNVNQGLLGMITPIPTCMECHIDWEFICFSQNGESVYKNLANVDCNSIRKWSDLTYVPFPTENAEWNMFYAYSYTGGQMDTTLLQYSLQGDTTISGIVYRKLCRNIGSLAVPMYKGVGGLREQDKRIYYVGESSYQFYNHEDLLYDFSKSLGDTVWVDDWRPEKEFRLISYIINKIDSIKIGTEYRKRYNDRFIEGIGDVVDGLLGVITPISTCIDCHQDWEFICFSQNGQTVYLNPAFVDCNSLLMSSISESKSSNQFVRINPNPTKEYIQFQFDFADKKNTTIEIIDYTGKRLATIPVTTGLLIYNFDISHYPAGVYFVLVHRLSGNEVHKIIKL